MQVDQCGLKTLVAQVLLDRLQTHAGFQKMRSVAVAQCVTTDFLGEPKLPRDSLDRTLNGRNAHRGF